MKTKYRIVTDNVCGYQAQRKKWYQLYWHRIDMNTHSSYQRAKSYLDGQMQPLWQSDQTEVKEKKGKVIEIGWYGVFVIICAVIGAICIIAMLISPWFPNFISK